MFYPCMNWSIIPFMKDSRYTFSVYLLHRFSKCSHVISGPKSGLMIKKAIKAKSASSLKELLITPKRSTIKTPPVTGRVMYISIF